MQQLQQPRRRRPLTCLETNARLTTCTRWAIPLPADVMRNHHCRLYITPSQSLFCRPPAPASLQRLSTHCVVVEEGHVIHHRHGELKGTTSASAPTLDSASGRHRPRRKPRVWDQEGGGCQNYPLWHHRASLAPCIYIAILPNIQLLSPITT